MSTGEASVRDTIAAIATPPGRGGIGVVRISGPRASAIAQQVLGLVPEPRRARHCTFRSARGEALDNGVALFFAAPASYTGEDVLELQGHGGAVVLGAVLGACLDAGARLAEPGEFTRRAFLEGRIDLVQAEAVADLIDAASRQAARSAMRSLQGEFSTALDSVTHDLTELRALIEAMIDFPEEEIDPMHRTDALNRLRNLRSAVDDILARCRQGSLLRSGVQVVLVGRPNVGKSSLLNRLAGEDRAIVTAIPGTTRDALRENIVLGGIPFTLIDTAGLREAQDEIERLGIDRTRQELGRTDLALIVVDARAGDAQAAQEVLGEIPTGVRTVVAWNKADLAPPPHPGDERLHVSAKTGAGIAALGDALLGAAGWEPATEESAFIARERHVRALGEVRGALTRAAERSDQCELFAEELRQAQHALGSVTGAVSADDLLGEIFSRFCIGK